MRKAFTRTQTLIQDVEATLRYRRSGEDHGGPTSKAQLEQGRTRKWNGTSLLQRRRDEKRGQDVNRLKRSLHM